MGIQLFSILIPTLPSRQDQFQQLYSKLTEQIHENSLDQDVEIVSFLDDGEHSVGFKRNKLIELAKGTFVAFVDDDDDVSEDYVPLICRTIKETPEIDCIGIKGLITFGGKHPRVFIHSVRYRDYFSRGGVYFRPPYHLNPIRRDIACRYRFEDISYSEDIDWAMRLCRDRALRREVFLDQVIYYYRSRRRWHYQLFLDWSEPIRHALGLRLSNRLRLKRRLRSLFKSKTNPEGGHSR
jgi:glycosyltransferase involved in cell wall biosynthesis